ncbi:hypothetical protein [Salinimicrobium sp. TH3]|uniref:hypothetical protein n=1 Tax=Salinimicrobium sp. TH3 TaxID=2997342 RepID=UPI002276CB17|nr:hypothetical protein [Salinimicrobium sp. TH3]MCY2686800.1 hypothetical protein [Salinimicrobium sp. TH3]
MKGISILIILLLILNSCATKKDRTNENLKECINEQILSSVNNIQEFAGSELTNKNNFDFFDTIADFEEKLVSNNVLEGRNKKDYKNLIDLLEKSKIAADLIIKLYEQDSFLAFISGTAVTTTSIYDYCPLTIVEKNQSRRVAKKKDIFDKIQMKGFTDYIPEIREYSEMIDFESDVERLQLSFLIYNYLNTHYWNRREREEPVFWNE